MSPTSGERVQVAGRALMCRVCGGDTFTRRQTTLDTSGIADSAGTRADLAVCQVCGYVHLFLGGALVWQGTD